MSASKAIKSINLPSVRYVAEHSDTKESVLYDWYNKKPIRFKALIHGVKALKEASEQNA